MCGRYVSKEEAAWESYFRLTRHNPLSNFESYNVAPTQHAPVVVQADGIRTMDLMRWGLIPSWAKDPKIGNQCINARAETVRTKPSFRFAFKARRCLVPASGYYEWERRASTKIPHYITTPDGVPMGFAGLWESWTDKETAEVVRSYAIVTTTASMIAAEIHDRMPVILAPQTYDTWLTGSADDAAGLLRPYGGELHIYAVSTRVNSPRNNDSMLISPVIYDHPPPLPLQ
jgi:putative SOS response-associated peptidase YedK